MSRCAGRLWALVALVLLWVAPGGAQAQMDLELRLSAREVAVGDELRVQLDAMSEDDQAPSNPELQAPNDFEVQGPTIGTRQQVSISGFNMVTQSGISATWLLTPSRPGVYTIGPASVQVGGERHQAQPVQVRVLPEGQRPQRPRRQRNRRAPFDPFDRLDRVDPFDSDPFDDLFDRLRGGGGGSRFDQLPEAPSDLVPEHAPDSLAFLTTHIDSQKAVVGQQITLAIYAHGAQGLFQEAPGAKEPTHPDFLAQRLVEDGSRQPVYQYNLDGQRWIAVKVRELGLFPLRAGRLEIGPLEFGFLGRRYGARQGEGLRRPSRALSIDVAEPPAAGRPPGYSGDVGDFELSAVVQPRSVPLGGTIAVTARVQGKGRLPGTLKLPERSGVEWLEPTLRDDLSVTEGAVGGTRTFNYLARLTTPGAFDLGILALPHYNPKTRRYQLAQVPLGTVNVEAPAVVPGAPPSASGSARPGAGSIPHLSDLVKFRSALGVARVPSYWADQRAFWWLLAGGPGAVLCLSGLLVFARRVRRLSEHRESSQATHATRALGEARHALASRELRDVASATERALYNAIEHATGLKARALLRSELEGKLAGAGVPTDVAARAVELLDRCGQLRHIPSESAAADALVQDADALVKRLIRKAPPRRTEPLQGEEAVR
jgi:hypothetical protein